MSEKLITKCHTPEFTVSYPQVWEPRAVEAGQEEKYSIAMLFDKDTDLSHMEEMAMNAAINKFGEDKARKLIEAGMLRSPFRKGWLEKPDDPHAGDKIFCNARSKDQPEVVMVSGSEVVPVMNKLDFYAGCTALAVVTFFGYDVAGNKGVAMGFDSVCKIAEGERIGGTRRPAKEEFAEFAAKYGKRAKAGDKGAKSMSSLLQ